MVEPRHKLHKALVMNFSVIHSFSSHIFSMTSHLKDSVIPALSPQQTKIGKIALATFCLIALAYYVASYLFAETNFTNNNAPFDDDTLISTEKIFSRESADSPAKLKSKIVDVKIEALIKIEEKDSCLNLQNDEMTVDPIASPIVDFTTEEDPTPYQAQIGLLTRSGGLIGPNLEAPPDHFNPHLRM